MRRGVTLTAQAVLPLGQQVMLEAPGVQGSISWPVSACRNLPTQGTVLGTTISEGSKLNGAQRRDMRMMKGLKGTRAV